MTTTTSETTERDQRVASAECYVRTRFYPPLPYQYGDYAVQAVDACNANDERREILLDPTLPVHPRAAERDDSGSVSIAAEDLVDALRLWHMVEQPCEDCDGAGIWRETNLDGSAGTEERTCETCSGRGMI